MLFRLKIQSHEIYLAKIQSNEKKETKKSEDEERLQCQLMQRTFNWNHFQLRANQLVTFVARALGSILLLSATRSWET